MIGKQVCKQAENCCAWPYKQGMLDRDQHWPTYSWSTPSGVEYSSKRETASSSWINGRQTFTSELARQQQKIYHQGQAVEIPSMYSLSWYSLWYVNSACWYRTANDIIQNQVRKQVLRISYMEHKTNKGWSPPSGDNSKLFSQQWTTTNCMTLPFPRAQSNEVHGEVNGESSSKLDDEREGLV